MGCNKDHAPALGDRLTVRERQFVCHFLRLGTAAAACRAAGYATSSNQSAGVLGHNVLKKPRVRAEVERRLRALDVTAQRVLEEIARVAFFDPRKLYYADGTLRPVDTLDDDTAAALAAVEVYEEYEGNGENRRRAGTTRKAKVWDKVAALGHLVKIMRMVPEKNQAVNVLVQNQQDQPRLPQELVDLRQLHPDDQDEFLGILARRALAEGNNGGVRYAGPLPPELRALPPPPEGGPTDDAA